MSDAVEQRPGFRQRQAATEQFIGALVKGAKTAGLYAAGHPLIAQVVGRVRDLMEQAVGGEPNLALELKAKSAFLEDTPLTPSPDVLLFASALHTLGIGQVLFTNRISAEGLLEFMRLLNYRPDEKRTLSDIQKAVQEVRIDGLQLSFILSFVVTGEVDKAEVRPGALSETQIAAYAAARDLPDFLHLLLLQCEPLAGKEAEAVTALLDKVLDREIPLEEFEEKMPWDLYDPRVRGRWDALVSDLRRRESWDRRALASQLALLDAQELQAVRSHVHHDAKTSFGYALDETHAILSNPAGERQPKYALFAYSRLLTDMGRSGDLDRLLEEHDLWRRMASEPKWTAYLAALRKGVGERAATPALAEALAARAAGAGPEAEAFERLRDFSLMLGPKLVPLLLDGLRKVPDRAAREKLCRLLTELCRRLGAEPLILALSDEDYFMVVQVIGMLGELALPETVRHLGPLLGHAHPKVRAAAVRALGRFGGALAVEALSGFIAACRYPEEVRLAVTAVSLIPEPGVGTKLIEAFPRVDYGTQVAVVTVLGRLPARETRAFLEAAARRSFMEMLTGRNKALRRAARESLDQVLSGEKAHGA